MTLSNAPGSNETVYTRMGRLLDLKIASEADAVRLVRNGLSSRAFLRIEGRLGLDADSVAPPSTRRRRIATKARLSRDESERVMRLARVYGEAVELFGDEKAALEWLKTPADYLQDDAPVTPLKLAESDLGARLIESHIRRTAYGFV